MDRYFNGNAADIKFYTVIGFSMQPAIDDGNIVIVLDSVQFSDGDIVMIEHSGERMVHRVRGIYSDYIVTQGDNNPYSEEVNKTDIKGVVIGVLFR